MSRRKSCIPVFIQKKRWKKRILPKFTSSLFDCRSFPICLHIDKCLLKWIWFNTNRCYKWHCCLLLFLAWLITESVYNDAFRTFTFSMQQCIVYMTKKIKIMSYGQRKCANNELLSYFQVEAQYIIHLFFNFFHLR
jgi:hypothetical protein